MNLTENVKGRNRFDRRPDIIRTLYEGALFISSLDMNKAPGKIIYILYKDGFFPWEFNEQRGIKNYDEDGELKKYELTLTDFLDEKIDEQKTSGFLAMDKVSLLSLMQITRFDKKYLNFGVGIGKVDILPK